MRIELNIKARFISHNSIIKVIFIAKRDKHLQKITER